MWLRSAARRPISSSPTIADAPLDPPPNDKGRDHRQNNGKDAAQSQHAPDQRPNGLHLAQITADVEHAAHRELPHSQSGE
jgi:hypothetical protein